MTKLLETVIERLKDLPDAEQDRIATILLQELSGSEDRDGYHLTDEQLAEIDRRLAEENPEVLTVEEARELLRRHGAL